MAKHNELVFQQRAAEISISIKGFDLDPEELPDFQEHLNLVHEELLKAHEEILAIEAELYIVDSGLEGLY